MSSTSLLASSTSLGQICWPSEEARAWAAQLLADATIDAVVAYGSAVRDVPGSNDVDLLIVSSSRPDFAPPLDVDLHWVDAAQVESSVAGGDEVLGWALRFGIPLLDRDGSWGSLVEQWQGRLPFPSAERADERARRAMAVAEGLRAAGDEEAADEVLLAALTQRARTRLIRAGIYPLSRPELPDQLTGIGEHDLVRELSDLLHARV